ncbi:MAG: hypothetical protein AAF907_00410, partial [Planctomycetota bacterium]
MKDQPASGGRQPPERTRNTLSVLGGRVIDPARGLDEIGDLHILDGRIVAE